MTADPSRFRWRLLAACVVLVGLAMTQSPGLLVPDTKLDLAIAPVDFLSRAAHLWDGEGAFGQLQNQAYGYLWPMGPFFALGHLLDVPGWVVQRLWMALVLCVAFLGAARVARALGVRSDLACILGGLAYALSPRMLTVIGPSSIEVWPMALAPWVLLPLVLGAERGSPRRAAAVSALAIAMVGGVNAAATSAVLPLGALWLLTREPGPRRRTMMLWWPLFTLLGTLWWLVPLFLLGSYSPPFLDFIESAGITTIPTDLADVLRGTSDWVPYVDSASRAGSDLIRDFYLPINSVVVLSAGLLGIAMTRTRDRLFLVAGVAIGLLMVSMGHVGGAQGWFAPSVQAALDGMLAPLRNVHKFDPVVRLPLVVGLAWLVDWLVALARDARSPVAERVNYRLLVGLVTFAVLAAATPAAAGRITPAGGFDAVPDYWRDAAKWLAAQPDSDTGVALLVPGTMFGSYVWGSPRDEPFQALAASPWAVRNAVPLAPPGNIRMLDAIEDRFAQGHGSAALTAYLRRNGIRHLVVRNDLARSDDHPDPVLVHQTISDSPGVELAATFGPAVGGQAHVDADLGRALINGGWQNDYDAIEIYTVSGSPPSGHATDEAPVVVGGPEDLLDLTELGVIEDVPTRLATDVGDGGAGGAPVVLTDGYRSVERHFGRVHDATSPVRTRSEADRASSAVSDYVLSDPGRWSTFADYVGIRDVRASSSLSDPGAGASSPGNLPFAALDGDPATAWQSTSASDEDGHWWEVELADDQVPTTVVVTGAGSTDQTVAVSTDDWTSEPVVLAPGNPTEIEVDDPRSDRLRVSDVSGKTISPLVLADVELPGVEPERVLVLPEVPEGSGAPEAVVLRAASDDRTGCVVVDLDVRCQQGRQGTPEESTRMSRRVTLPEASAYGLSMRVRGRPGSDLDALLQQGALARIAASSTGVADPRASAVAAVDGSDLTTWYADLSDVRPSLDLRWVRPQVLDSISVSVDPDTAARAPQTLTLTWPRGEREVTLDETGSASFGPIRTAELTLEVGESQPATSVDFEGQGHPVPVGISELELGGAQGLPLQLDDRPLELSCGTGPELLVNGERLQTSVSASARDLFERAPVTATPCGATTSELRAGDNIVSARASTAFLPLSVVLSRVELPLGETTVVDGTSDGHGSLRLEPSPGSSVVASFANANDGWSATRRGDALSPVVVDGWRQGWDVSGGTGTVSARFAPGTAYRWSLGLGALGALTLVGWLVTSRIRRAMTGRPELPPLAERVPRPLVLVVLVPLLGGFLAGWIGAAVSVVALGVVGWISRVHAPTARGLVVLPVVPAIGVFAVQPWGGFGTWAGSLGWPSYLVVAVLSGLVVLLAADSRARRRPRNRSAGISTVR